MPTTNVAVRLGVEGEAEIVRAGRTIRTELAGGYAAAGQAANEAGSQADAALSRQEARWRRVAQAQRELAQAEAEQGRINMALGVGQSPAAASGLTAAYFEEMERDARAAEVLRAQIDPLRAAQDRFNAEVAEAKGLLDRGAISAREYGQAQEMAKGRLDATTMALQNQERGLSRLAVASRLNLARQGADVLTTAAMGMNPAMIAIQQGPQILDAWSTSGIKATGAMVALGGAVTGTTAAIIAGIVAYEQSANRLELMDRAAEGLGATAGLTGEQLQALSREAAGSAEISIRAAEDQAIAYISTGRIGEEMIGNLIGLHRDFAAVMGTEGPEATQRLATSFADPARGARDLNEQLWFLDQTTLRHIETMALEGDRLGAQTLLYGELEGALANLGDELSEIDSLWKAIARSASDAWTATGEFFYQTDAERIRHIQQQLAMSSPGRSATRDDLESELQILQYRQEMRRWRENAAADNQEQGENQGVIDRYDPQARRRTLDAERNRLVGLRGNADYDAAELERAIANIDRQIEGLGRTAREALTEAERLAARIADQIVQAQAGEAGLVAYANAWLMVAEGQARAGEEQDAYRLRWAALAEQEDVIRQSTINGVEQEALARARLGEMVAQATADAARSAGELRLESQIRADLNARLAAGALSMAEYDAAMEDAERAQMRQILLLNATDEAQTRVNTAFTAWTRAVEEARAAEAETDRLAFIREAMDDADALLARIGLINAGATEAEQRIADAVRDARRELEDRNIDPESPRGQEAIAAARSLAEAENDLDRADSARRYSDELERQNELVQAQLSLVWLDERARDRILRRLELINDLVADGLSLEDERVQAILRQHDAYEDMSDLLDRQMQLTGGLREDAYDTWTEMRQALSDGQEGWERMGDIGEDALKRIAAQVLALAILNPFENWAFGSNLPTFGNLGDGFWSTAASSAGNWFSNFLGRIPGFATGTDDAPEGMAWVGEHGKELMQVPGGSRIFNHGQSMGIASRSREAAPVVNLNINLNAEGADAEALARLERRLDDLPGEMLELVGEADSRFILRRR